LPLDGDIEIDEHYFSIAPWFFGLVAAFTILSGLSDLLVPGEEPTPLFIPLTFGTLLIRLAVSKRRAIHRLVLAMCWTLAISGFQFGRT
jgi:hypothetical protein